MASTRRERPSDGIEFVREDDGSITARDLETGLARGGATRVEALSELADVLALAAEDGDSIEDPDEFLAENGVESASGVEQPPWE